ncbi:MAG: hypothetical protein ACREC6_03695, partial [Hyphomicrobiaceae bacterium]
CKRSAQDALEWLTPAYFSDAAVAERNDVHLEHVVQALRDQGASNWLVRRVIRELERRRHRQRK